MFIKILIKQFNDHYELFSLNIKKEEEVLNDYFWHFMLELNDVWVLLNDNTTWDYVFDVLNQNRGFASAEVDLMKDFIKSLISLILRVESFVGFSYNQAVSKKLVSGVIKTCKLILGKFVVH